MKITVENSGTVGWWERRERGGGTMLAFRSADVCSWSDSIGRPWIIRYFLTERLFGPRWGIVARDRISITRRSMMIGISVLYRFLFFAFFARSSQLLRGIEKKKVSALSLFDIGEFYSAYTSRQLASSRIKRQADIVLMMSVFFFLYVEQTCLRFRGFCDSQEELKEYRDNIYWDFQIV